MQIGHTLYLFADTNLFIQCRVLEEIDWSAWSDFAEVHLIVSRPVQREIDRQKNRSNDRVGRRARKAYERFRALITSDKDHAVVRESAPRVKLFLAGPSRPASEFSDVLDYTKPDDEIVGYVAEYRKQHEGRDARLLTHDSGPMMAAKTQDLPFVPIPDSWLLAPERSETDKENERLRERVRKLETGPEFDVGFVDENGGEVQGITTSLRVHAPLSRAEIDELMRPLRGRSFPRSPFGLARGGDAYRKWLERCERVFATLHRELQVESGGVRFGIAARNSGVAPARDVLVEITARGDLLVLPYIERDEDESRIRSWRMSLPSPPTPIQGLMNSESIILPSRHNGGYERDPNEFYYKPSRPDLPATSYALECKQWRHGFDDEHFDGEIFPHGFSDEVHGAIECMIHAENLGAPVKVVAHVRIELERVTVVERAKALLDDLASRG